MRRGSPLVATGLTRESTERHPRKPGGRGSVDFPPNALLQGFKSRDTVWVYMSLSMYHRLPWALSHLSSHGLKCVAHPLFVVPYKYPQGVHHL